MNQQIKERLEATLEKYVISQNRAAKDIGYSSPVLSDYRNNKYAGDVEGLEEAIVKWIGRTEQAYARKKVPVVETDQLRHIVNAIAMAHAEEDIALIVDDAGGGKTTAARYYAEQNPRTTIYIDVVKGMNARALILKIAEDLSMDTQRVNQQALIQNVSAALADRNMVVILDEADYLKADALEFSRRLVNDLGKSGLVLIGLPRLTGTIQNLKNDHRQLESRIGVYLPLAGLTKKDAKKIAQSVWPAVDDEVVDAMYRISRTDARQFVKIIERAQNTMAVNKLPAPDLNVVETAAMLVMRRNWR
ncbi:MAG: AAA family ATPase [Treponema sp.]|jgi:DNA transposition AAA+ family ATPase|nr:AAA family ATPase [Treponema sp.]